MRRIDQLKDIIDAALQNVGRSKLTSEVIDSVGGFISPNNRHLLNNLAAISTSYLEVGSHVGSSLISSVYRNDHLLSAIGVDNFSLFSTAEHDSKREFLSNCERHISGKYKLIEKDCFTITADDLETPPDLYFFDGAHDYESQKRGITYFMKFLAPEAIIVVDDTAWEEPNSGTINGLIESGVHVQYLATLDSGVRSDCSERGFWNGLTICLIKK